MVKFGQYDRRLFLFFLLLLIFGLMMLSSASSAVGQQRFGDGYFFIKRQILFGALPGFLIAYILARVKWETMKRWSGFLFLFSLALLVIVFIPGIGSTLNTAARSWLVVGNFSFQPAEFAKCTLIIFLAVFLAKRGEELRDFQKGFLPSLVIACLPVALILLQPDVGTAAIFFAIIFTMFFVAQTKLWHMASLLILGIIGITLMILVAPYRAARLTVFLHPELDPAGVGYQTTQALVSIGSGGIYGLGLGNSRQKFQYLPEVHADSIFAVIAEEMGFIISVAFIILLLLIAWRLSTLARQAHDPSMKYALIGIMSWFMAQSFMNIGAAVGILPLTGVPLPFVSHGGTALMVSLGAVGVALGMSKRI